MSRIFVNQIIVADAQSTSPGTLGSMGLKAGSIFAAEAADDIKAYPFLTMRWGITQRGVADVSRQTFDVWCHDRDRDYLLIDAILKRIRSLLTSAGPGKAEADWVTQIDWQGDGPDAHDDGYDTVTRNSSYILIGSTR
jgi:hypothetical protein